MDVAHRTAAPTGARTFEAGTLLLAAGALLLLISLFLEFYQPGVDAWEVFEVWDLVLAALAVTALVTAASRLGFGPPRPPLWVLGPAVAAFVIVLYGILDPPPLTGGLGDGDPGTGLWLALAATLLMAAGAVLSVARISVAFTAAGAPAAGPAPRADRPLADPLPGDPVAPARGRRFARGAGGGAGADPVDPAAPGSHPPTEPTRRL
jgi:hypothetical protein